MRMSLPAGHQRERFQRRLRSQQMTAFGTTRTSGDVRLESVKGSKADIDQAVGRGRTAGARGASMALILKRASASRTLG
jgi:hypothetical protein